MINSLVVLWEDEPVGLLERSGRFYIFRYLPGYTGDCAYLELVFPQLRGDPTTAAVALGLWPTFAKRIPQRSRPDYADMMAEWGCANEDPFEILAKSGGRLVTDRLSLRLPEPEGA